MTFGKIFLLPAAVLFSAPLAAGVTVVGSSPARICYEAAEAVARPSRDQVDQCNVALTGNLLSPYEKVATHVNRGILLVRWGSIESGISDFDRAIALDPDQPEAYLNKGAALVRLGNARAALPLFTAALEKNTKRPAIAYYGRGVAFEELGNIRLAYLDFRRASEADPKWSAPREELSRFSIRK